MQERAAFSGALKRERSISTHGALSSRTLMSGNEREAASSTGNKEKKNEIRDNKHGFRDLECITRDSWLINEVSNLGRNSRSVSLNCISFFYPKNNVSFLPPESKINTQHCPTFLESRGKEEECP